MLRVLIVEDIKIMAKIMKSIIEQLGFEVVAISHDGRQGLDHFLEHRPDVTLLDVTMPVMCGVECLTKIKEAEPDARVVMLSALKDQEVIGQCMELGASDFLLKPIRKDNEEDYARLRQTLENAAQIVV